MVNADDNSGYRNVRVEIRKNTIDPIPNDLRAISNPCPSGLWVTEQVIPCAECCTSRLNAEWDCGQAEKVGNKAGYLPIVDSLAYSVSGYSSEWGAILPSQWPERYRVPC